MSDDDVMVWDGSKLVPKRLFKARATPSRSLLGTPPSSPTTPSSPFDLAPGSVQPKSAAEKWFESKAVPPMQGAASGIAKELLGGNVPNLPSGRNPLNLTNQVDPAAIGKALTPQTIPQAAIAGANLIPGIGELGIVGRLAAATAAGALGSKIAGQGFTPGMVQGLGGQAAGEVGGKVLGGALNLMPHMAQNDFRNAVADILGLDELRGAQSGNIVEAFREGTIEKAVAARTAHVDQRVDHVLQNETFTVPSLNPQVKVPKKVSWDQAKQLQQSLGTRGWNGVTPKDGDPARLARNARTAISNQVKQKLAAKDPEVASMYKTGQDLWTRYYALNNEIENSKFRAGGGQFTSAEGQREFAKNAKYIRSRLGEQDYKRLQKGLYGGSTQHAGFSEEPQKGRLRVMMGGMSPLPRVFGSPGTAGKTIGRTALPLKVIKALGVKPGSAEALQLLQELRNNMQ